MKIADFFTSATVNEDEEEKEKGGVKSTVSNRLVQKGSSTNERQSQLHIVLNLKVEKPDIILVEDMDSIDTNALILNVSS